MSKQGVEIAIYSGLIAVGGAAGFVGGYFFAKKKWRAIADEEIFNVKKTYNEAKILESVSIEELQERYKTDRAEDHEVKPMTPEALKNTIGYVPGDNDPRPPAREFVEDPAVTAAREVLKKDREQVEALEAGNVFDNHGDDVAFEPTPDRPYLVSVETYNSTFNDKYERMTLTYYAGDGAVADEGDNLVDSLTEVLGDKALGMFGVRSDDPDIVYVMNERYGVLYEVVRKEGTYGEIINANPQE